MGEGQVAYNGSYAVTVDAQPTGQTCTVTSGAGSSVTASVSSVSVTCSSITYAVGGTVSGLGVGQQVTLKNNAADPITVTANGAFNFVTPVGLPPPGRTLSIGMMFLSEVLNGT